MSGRILLLAITLLTCLLGPAHAATRVALVIGMSKYQEVPKLTNPANDADAMAALFRRAGFDLVEGEHDLGISGLRRAVRDFAEKARDAEIAVVYYAGHGIEMDGNNYLIPTDAKLLSDFDVQDEAMSLDRVLKAIEPAKRLKLVILDACRDNPFAKTMKRTIASRAIGRGLAEVEPNNSDMLIAFAAKAGAVASDGDGKNSPFASALVKHLTEPGLDLRIAFGRVRDEVLKSTGNRQEPFVYGSLGGDTLALVPKTVDPDAQAKVEYELAAQIGTKEAWDSFLDRHASGYFADLARAQNKKIGAAQDNRTKADDAKREAEAQATQKATEYRKQLEEQSARETEQARQKLSEQSKKELEEQRRQLAEQARQELQQAKQQLEQAQRQAEAAREQLEEAKRQGAADAKTQVETKPAVENPGGKVAALTPDQPAAAAQSAPASPSMDPSDIARLLQAHLKRVGCNGGSLDGNWDEGSRKALDLFNRNAGTKFDVKVASLDALDFVRGRTDRVCPLVCAKGQKQDGDRCIQIACRAGYVLNASGECEKKAEPAPSPRVSSGRTSPPPSARGGGKCFSFGGKTYCE
ncbi:caspase family protein [Bradyrhizobium sp.]|uniref:caspase family protein n=1 Tax=Bradyrhizobium sp. TaxID=376 RepID=UPI0039E67046